jgi:purine nucleosidase
MAQVEIETEGRFTSGMTVVDFRGRGHGPMRQIATGLNVDLFWDRIADALGRIGVTDAARSHS